MITAQYDEVTGIVWIKATGLASIDEFNAYVPAVRKMLELSRKRHGGYLHLIDVSNNPVQAKDVFDHMASASEGAINSDDRIAIVIRSTLARMQLKRMFCNQAFFSNCIAAEQWLLAQVNST